MTGSETNGAHTPIVLGGNPADQRSKALALPAEQPPRVVVALHVHEQQCLRQWPGWADITHLNAKLVVGVGEPGKRGQCRLAMAENRANPALRRQKPHV